MILIVRKQGVLLIRGLHFAGVNRINMMDS